MAGGIATIIKEADPDIVIKVIPGGGLQNPAVVADKGAEMGWGLPFLNAAAYQGMAPFEKPLTELCALAGGMSMNYFHFYVDAESPFNSMDEIFGQKKKMRIAISQAGSFDTWVLERVLEAYKTSIPELEKAGFVFARGNYAFQANVYQPALLLNGSLRQIAVSVALTVFGVVCQSPGVIGHLFGPLRSLQRLALIAAAGFLVFSAQIDVILGRCAGIGGLAWSFIDSRATAARHASASPEF